MKIKLLQKKSKYIAGFTLVELVVSLAIMGIMMSVVAFQHRGFSERIQLQNTAYELALVIREAQSYGINVRQEGSGSGAGFDGVYGVYLSDQSNNNDTNKTYYLFYDTNENIENVSFNVNQDEIIAEYTLPVGQSIADVYPCGGGAGPEVNSLTIMFKRPSPEAIMKSNGNNTLTQGCILIESQNRYSEIIQVNSTGRITIEE
ncbi:MAG: prepilin-type N-terminal cleavage/methylation domain-containing protein [Candidatus Paceibacterota bacterium]